MTEVCSVSTCSRQTYCRDLCQAHYTRLIKKGDVFAEIPLSTKRGSRKEFLESIADTESKECIIWPFSKTNNGYGQYRVNGQREDAHRAICRMRHGDPVSPSMFASHTCGNRACVNPNHLVWETQSQNLGRRWVDGTETAGERHYKSKLTDKDALNILNDNRTHAEIAADYRVSETAVWRIKNRKSYKRGLMVTQYERRKAGLIQLGREISQ